MKPVRYAIAVLILFAATPALAQQEWAFPERTADFVAKCKRERAWCGAALKGMHTRDAFMSAIRTHYCVPDRLSPRARTSRVLAFLARHPEVAEGSARESLLAASRALWPCRGTRYVDPFPCGVVPDSKVQNRACEGGPAPAR